MDSQVLFSDGTINFIQRAYDAILKSKIDEKDGKYLFKSRVFQRNVIFFSDWCTRETLAKTQAAACCMQVFYSVLTHYAQSDVLKLLSKEEAAYWTPRFLVRLKAAILNSKSDEAVLLLTNAPCALNAMQFARKIVECVKKVDESGEEITAADPDLKWQIHTCITICLLCINAEKLRFALSASGLGLQRESTVECNPPRDVSTQMSDDSEEASDDDADSGAHKRRRHE